MERLSKHDDELESISESLERLNSKFFLKFTDVDLTGGKRYVPMWKCVILLELVKYLQKRNFNIQRENYCSLVEALDKMGLLEGSAIEDTLTTLDSTEFSISLNNWITYGRHIEKTYIIKGPDKISTILMKEIAKVYLSKKKFRMIFDGMDDILRSQDFNVDIVTGLIRAANEINNSFVNKDLNFKVIVLIRSDILDKCRDPDISKIKFASRINLNWKIDGNPYDSELMAMVLARFNMTSKVYQDVKSMWLTYFPNEIDGKDSLQYMIENTLYKPRDVLMFFTIVQRYLNIRERRLSPEEFKIILNQYSEDYFYLHMQDELTGFLPDNAIYELKSVISKIGSRRFSFDKFQQELDHHQAFNGIAAEDILKLLFDRGYIGQYRKRPDHPKEEFLFQVHINPNEVFQKDDDCLVHRGLTRAFGI